LLVQGKGRAQSTSLDQALAAIAAFKAQPQAEA
jgi:hypothetical protein